MSNHSNPAQSLSPLVFSGVRPHSRSSPYLPIIATVGQIFIRLLYLGQVLRPHIELTRIRPIPFDFDSSVGRALHRHCRGRGFESRSESDFFQAPVSEVLDRTRVLHCIYL